MSVREFLHIVGQRYQRQDYGPYLGRIHQEADLWHFEAVADANDFAPINEQLEDIEVVNYQYNGPMLEPEDNGGAQQNGVRVDEEENMGIIERLQRGQGVRRPRGPRQARGSRQGRGGRRGRGAAAAVAARGGGGGVMAARGARGARGVRGIGRRARGRGVEYIRQQEGRQMVEPDDNIAEGNIALVRGAGRGHRRGGGRPRGRPSLRGRNRIPPVIDEEINNDLPPIVDEANDHPRQVLPGDDNGDVDHGPLILPNQVDQYDLPREVPVVDADDDRNNEAQIILPNGDDQHVVEPVAENNAVVENIPPVRQNTNQRNHIMSYCIICVTEEANIVLIPCGHICSCAACTPYAIENGCPECRQIPEHTYRVYNSGFAP